VFVDSNVRNGGAMASGLSLTFIEGVALRAMHAHEGQASLRCLRLGEDGFAVHEIAISAITRPANRPNDFRTI
jgi:hypothetical protein